MLACDKPAGWRPNPGYAVRPGRLELARLDDLLNGCDDEITVVKMDVEVQAPTDNTQQTKCTGCGGAGPHKTTHSRQNALAPG